MKGKLLGCRDGLLMISGDDGQRYDAVESELPAHDRISGTTVDFENEGTTARKLFVVKPSSGQKRAWIAATLATFLGWLGADRFYVGRPGEGVLIAVAYIGTMLVLMMALSENPYSTDLLNIRGLVGPAFVLFGIIRGVMYLVRGQAPFAEKYAVPMARNAENA